MKKITKLLSIVAILISITFAANAQPGSTTGGDPFEDSPEDVPIDGGIVMLAAAGVAYGYKKIKNRSSSKNINS